jgi:uncharacterized membrane protein YoaK (UPF0700 family)
MIYGNESISHYSKGNVAIWMSMAFQAGLLNIGGFLACHRFVSHVTGFATFFGVEVNRRSHNEALGMLFVPLFFLLGAMISGQLVDVRLKLHLKPRYYISFGIIFALLLAVFAGGMTGFFGAFGEPLALSRDYTLLSLLCLVCGIQNGTITTASKAVVRTTHLTGITTDLGLGLMRVLNRGKLKEEISGEGRANLMRIGLIFFFGLGSILGGFVFGRFGYLGFAIPLLSSGLLFGTMLYFQLLRPQKTG